MEISQSICYFWFNNRNEEIETLNFGINVTVTDIQGETRTASQNIVVGKEMLKMYLNVNSELISEENNKLTISATTLNNYLVDANGTIKIYELKKKNFLKDDCIQFQKFKQ